MCDILKELSLTTIILAPSTRKVGSEWQVGLAAAASLRNVAARKALNSWSELWRVTTGTLEAMRRGATFMMNGQLAAAWISPAAGTPILYPQ